MVTLENIDKKIVLYGAGAQNVRFAYWFIASAGLKVEKIVDKDPQKQGTFCFGTEVTSPEWLFEQDRNGESYIVIISVRTPNVVAEIKNSLAVLKNAEVYSTEEYLENGTKLRSKAKRIFGIMVHLTDHCNLNCAYCSHFSPLVLEESYLDEEIFERDIKRLYELTHGDVTEIQMVGGEPLLHPRIQNFPVIARKYFPTSDIVLITNGIKLKSMPKSFFDVCKECRVQVWLTKYPIDFDYDGAIEFLRGKGIDAQFANTGDTVKSRKEMEKLPLRLEGSLNEQINFDNCDVCRCYPLENGQLYVCQPAAYIKFFNNYFHKSLPELEANGVDLFAVQSLEELMGKLSKPIPLCGYCDSVVPINRVPWSTSKRDISEWTICDD